SDGACFCFFFSSRRRHTRFSRDWSSDVCSSDLVGRQQIARALEGALGLVPLLLLELRHAEAEPVVAGASRGHDLRQHLLGLLERSEERRVGKECRSRWSPYRHRKRSEEPKTCPK